ncbi:glycosyltransferase family 2 protein [Pseudonocardia sp. N23]|uniref:glycosyltransferase family 2 protein n=1 Tax=Pseudonocardia sp. N23 TaxID=1987376 RepID=UPI000BFB61E4|nr:glycosyltransferase family 2 protein [Pseudonocardia sp. N23]GAY12216.1 glycosyl transferase, group 2 family protein [Pseudonocardia sp. N23]
MSEGPKVDVVIPCYRYGALLPASVRSVLAQDGVDVRVLIIDDASGDGSADVARGLAAADPRVSVEVHPENRGHIATFNEGVIEWAREPYTLLISADDELAPGALQRATTLLEDNPGVGLTYGNSQMWEPEDPGRPVLRTGRWRPIVYPGHSWLRRRCASGTNPVFSPSVVVRTALQKQVGGYDPRMLHTSDLEMWLRMALYADIGFVAGVDQSITRVHEKNMSSTYLESDHGLEDLRMRLLAFDAVLDRGADLLPDADRLRRRMRRALARDALMRLDRAEDKNIPLGDTADALAEFARETCSAAIRSPEGRALRRRHTLGPRLAAVVRPPIVAAARRKLRQETRDRVQLHRGV